MLIIRPSTTYRSSTIVFYYAAQYVSAVQISHHQVDDGYTHFYPSVHRDRFTLLSSIIYIMQPKNNGKKLVVNTCRLRIVSFRCVSRLRERCQCCLIPGGAMRLCWLFFVQQCENLPAEKDAMLSFSLLNFEILLRSTSSLLNQDSPWSWSSYWKRLGADLSPQRLGFESRPVCGISVGQSVTGTCFCPSNYCFPYLLTYLLTPWSRVLLEKLTVCQLVKNFPAFYGTRRYITAFTSARHMFLFWASSIQFIPPHPTSWRSFLLSSHLRLGLSSGLCPSGFPTNTCIRLTYWFPINIISPVHHTQLLFFYHRRFIAGVLKGCASAH